MLTRKYLKDLTMKYQEKNWGRFIKRVDKEIIQEAKNGCLQVKLCDTIEYSFYRLGIDMEEFSNKIKQHYPDLTFKWSTILERKPESQQDPMLPFDHESNFETREVSSSFYLSWD